MTRWAWAAVVLCVACGPTETERPPPGECEPRTCDGAGASCGAIGDGCGGTLQCGTCGDGQTCSAENTCEDEACVPTTCETAGKNCGVLPDGCGGTLQCGSCAGDETCGGGGSPNVCGEGSCTPTTCEAEGKTCGAISDGCGGIAQCGTCGDGQRCTDENVCVFEEACTPRTCDDACGALSDGCGGTLECGGCGEGQTCTDNVCAASEPQTRVKWFKQPETWPRALAPDNKGGLLVAFGERIARFTTGGAQSWSLSSPELEVHYDDLEATPDGKRFYAIGDGPCVICGGLIDTFSTEGDDWRRHNTFAGEVTRWDVTPDGRGGVGFIENYNANGDDYVQVETADGQRLRFGPSSTDEHGYNVILFSALTRALDGGWIATAYVREPGRILDWEVGREDGPTFVFYKLDRELHIQWVREYAVNGSVTELEVSDKGTIVAAVNLRGSLKWGNDTVSGAALLVMEPNGAERWARRLEGSTLEDDPLGILGSGEVVVTSLASDGYAVERYALDGKRLWRHLIARKSETRDDDGISVTGVAVVNGEAMIGGRFTGAFDFGDGQTRTGNETGFLLNLGR